MKPPSSLRVFSILACITFLTTFSASAFAADISAKPRLIVLTDISNEPDDEESLVRLLVYSNEFDIEGLVATTSVWLRDQVRPELLLRDIHAYGLVRPNLLMHSPGFPTAEHLESVVNAGLPVYGMPGVGEGKSSGGSRLLIAAAERDDPRPLWITIWGGPNCLAQALWDLSHTRTPAEVEKLVRRLRVYAISDQDESGYWIRQNYPSLFYIVSPTTQGADEYPTATWSGISGDRFFRNGPREHFELVDNPWLTAHIRVGHGPLGELYPAVKYIMEGDTPSFLNLIPNGLSSAQSPDWGGWGGRYTLRQVYGETRPIWTNSRDTVQTADGHVCTSNQATVWRWREAFQHDFANRMEWCVKEPAEVNHHPVAIVNGVGGRDPLRIAAKAGDEIRLSAAGSFDPDHDHLAYRWFYYAEAGGDDTRPETLDLTGTDTETATLRVPTGSWHSLHIILEIRDDGTPSLFSYRRIIVSQAP